MTSLTDNPAMDEMLRLAQQETAKASANTSSAPDPLDEAEKITSLGRESSEDKLTPEELQALREMLARNSIRGRDYYELPDKPVTPEDRQRFYDSVGDRKTYSETMVIIPNKLEVTFRCKTRREVEAIESQIQLDLEDSLIKNERHHATARTNYNLMFQMAKINGADCNNAAVGVSNPKFSLRGHINNHIIATLPQPMMFLLCGALSQFERRIDVISKECLESNFPKPATL